MSGRRTPRKFFRGPKKSYSIERQIFTANLSSGGPSGNTVVVPASTEQGKRKVKNAGLLCSLIQDAGLTEFDGVPTYTCCAIGPNWDEDVNKITGHLKLL